MLKINDHKMNLDLTKLGWVRRGVVLCPKCKTDHDKETSPLYGQEARGRACDQCGVWLVQPQVQVAA